MNSPALKIVDFSTHFSGSIATRFLAHLGADVVKVENPRLGDGNRGVDPLIEGEAMLHLALNAGKRSVALDRRSEQWEPAVKALTRWADVAVYGAVPDAARSRGLDFETLAGFNDQIVHCLITGYGEVGPWRDLPSHGLNTDVLAGLVPVETIGGQPSPRDDFRSVGTTLCGIYAALGIMEGLRRRDLGGGAQRVLVSVWQAAMSWQWRDTATQANLGRPMDPYGDLGSRYAMYLTSDERSILICPIEKKYWVKFCRVIDLAEAYETTGSWEGNGMDFGKGYEDERSAIAECIAEQSLDHWVTAFEEAQIPFAPLLNTQEVLASEQAEAVRVMAETQINGAPVKIPNIPIAIGTLASVGDVPLPPARVPGPPNLGEHTDEVLGELL